MTASEATIMDFVRTLLSGIEIHITPTQWQARNVLGIPTLRYTLGVLS